jgi:glycosyltransferase involved in cell wall biosynthesis
MPFWDFAYFETRFSAIKSISERVKEVHVVHVEGKPEELWKKYVTFHKIEMPEGKIKSKIFRLFLHRKKMYNQIKGIDCDLICTSSGIWAQEASRYYSSLKHSPYVVYVRGANREVRKAAKTNKLAMMVIDYLDTRSLKQANMVIPISNSIMKKLETWGIAKEKISSPAYIGVDTDMFKPMKVERTKEFTVAYAGRICPEKRVVDLLKIAERLKDIHFIIAGKKQMPISFPENVEYCGSLSLSEMPEFYNKADLIVLPSITEGLGGVILEAYACGKPVLIAKDAVQEELKMFGAVSEIDMFESEIVKLKNSDLKALSSGARAYIQSQFTWDNFGDFMLKNFKRVLDQTECCK